MRRETCGPIRGDAHRASAGWVLGQNALDHPDLLGAGREGRAIPGGETGGGVEAGGCAADRGDKGGGKRGDGDRGRRTLPPSLRRAGEGGYAGHLSASEVPGRVGAVCIAGRGEGGGQGVGGHAQEAAQGGYGDDAGKEEGEEGGEGGLGGKESLRESFKAAPAPQEVRAAVSFVEVALEAPAEEDGASLEDTLTKLQGSVMANPGDLEARYNLALKNFQLQRFETSIDACLEVRGGEGGKEGGREKGNGKKQE